MTIIHSRNEIILHCHTINARLENVRTHSIIDDIIQITNSNFQSGAYVVHTAFTTKFRVVACYSVYARSLCKSCCCEICGTMDQNSMKHCASNVDSQRWAYLHWDEIFLKSVRRFKSDKSSRNLMNTIFERDTF